MVLAVCSCIRQWHIFSPFPPISSTECSYVQKTTRDADLATIFPKQGNTETHSGGACRTDMESRILSEAASKEVRRVTCRLQQNW